MRKETIATMIAIAMLMLGVISCGCLGSDGENSASDSVDDDDNDGSSDTREDVCRWDFEVTTIDGIGEGFGTEYLYEPTEGNELLLVTIRVVNGDDGTVSTNPYAWELTANGITYTHHVGTYTDEIGHQLVDIGNGGDMTFRFVYEVTEGASSITMTYDYFGGPEMVYDDSLL